MRLAGEDRNGLSGEAIIITRNPDFFLVPAPLAAVPDPQASASIVCKTFAQRRRSRLQSSVVVW
jgi:hypothetical protein